MNRIVHIGILQHNSVIIKVFTQASLVKLIYEINTWFFEHYKLTDLTVYQLPPLDDWEHSVENDSYYEVFDPSKSWKVSIQEVEVQFLS